MKHTGHFLHGNSGAWRRAGGGIIKLAMGARGGEAAKRTRMADAAGIALRAWGLSMTFVWAAGCAQIATSMLINVAPELLAVSLNQYGVRKEFEEIQPLIKARDWLGLSTLARQKLEKEPARGEWWQLAGYGHMQSGEMPIARDCFLRVTQLLPEEIHGWNLYALTLKQTGETRAALNALDRALQVDPTSAAALVLQGDIYAEMRRPVEAARAYERVLQLDGQDIFAWYGLGLLGRRTGDAALTERALKALRPLYAPFADDLARK